jgi:hypothetical protein
MKVISLLFIDLNASVELNGHAARQLSHFGRFSAASHGRGQRARWRSGRARARLYAATMTMSAGRQMLLSVPVIS